MHWTLVFLAAARQLLGVPYEFGGRDAKKGIDCQGLIFLAAEAVKPCSWKSYSVYPTKTVKWRELGAPVPGLSPVSREELDVTKLQPGDHVMLLSPTENPAEPALTTLGEVPQWVWHVGLYSGDGSWLNADPFAGKVSEQPLAAYLADHGYSGIYVTRMRSGPTPARCR
jgi:hypothetical protein